MIKNTNGSEPDPDLNHEITDDEDFDTMTLTLEDGREIECEVLAVFPVYDKQYIALLPVSDESESDEGMVYLYQYVELENDEIDLISIEDDDEYDVVADAFDEMIDEQTLEELCDELFEVDDDE